MKRFFYRSQQTAVGAVLLTVFLLLVMPEGVRARLKSAIGGLFLPAVSISTAGQAALESLGQLGVSDRDPFPANQAHSSGPRAVSSITELQLENDRLAGENKRLREAVEWGQRIPWETRLARVVGRDTFNWWRRINSWKRTCSYPRCWNLDWRHISKN